MIGIDLGGTRIKGVVLNDEGKVLHQAIVSTEDDQDGKWKAHLKNLMDQLIPYEKGPLTIGISAPGLPNKDHTAIAYMPGRMEGLENFIWQDFLGHPTKVLNDGVAALLAEARFGVAVGKNDLVMLTLGTGVGGAIMINGKPYFGHQKKAGHIGHMVINDTMDKDVTGMPGSIEECIGNCTVERRSDGKFHSTKTLVEAMHNGDAFAKSVWDKSIRQLGICLASLANLLSPEAIILGGGITEVGDDLFIPVKAYMQEFEWTVSEETIPIIKAYFGENAGAVGAACFGKENI